MAIETEENREMLAKFQLIADNWKKKRGLTPADEIQQGGKEKIVVVRKSLFKN